MGGTRIRTACLALMALCLALLAGCAGGLPTIRDKYILSRAQTIPASAEPTFSWHASQDVIFTYWGRQSAALRVRAWIPAEEARAGESIWEVEAQTGEGKPLHYIGIEKLYINEKGEEAAKLVPPLDLERTPAGLYIVISPGTQYNGGKLSRVAPVANVREIRRNMFTPLCYPIPLVPDVPSELTPTPPARPVEPEGTAMPN